MLAKKISRNAFFYRTVFPAMWFGFLFVFLGIALFATPRRPPLPLFIPPLVMLPLGFVLFRKLVGDVVDEVWDCGDHLIVKRGDRQETVAFSNIMNVNATVLVNPPRITLRLVHPGRFGAEIAFHAPRPPFMNPFARNALADQLIERAHAARSPA